LRGANPLKINLFNYLFMEIFKYNFLLMLIMKKGNKLWFFLIYLAFGLYFINYHFQFLQIPDSVTKVDSWIIFVGGILVIIGGINYLRASRNNA